MRAVKHWTPRYIGNRLRVLLYERLHPDDPWLTNSMVNILESWLKPEDMGIEWGSGRSTIWLAGRVKHLTSVEHDGSWYGKISSRLQQREISNVDYRLCADEVDYVATSEGLLPESLDFCLVDGIARDQCAIAVIPKLKPGGILIIDNCNWYLPSESKSPNSQRAQNLTSRNGWK
ncbi:MAG: hypothetical protein ACREA9_04670, partial [Pyrinomonadaceae bacterium]